MKMKKLLSMGALALVLVSSLSVGASAAESGGNSGDVGNKTKIILKILGTQYSKGTNHDGVFSGINKDSKIGSVASTDFLNALESNSEVSGSTLNTKYAEKYKNNKDKTIKEVAVKLTDSSNPDNEAKFNDFKADVVHVLTKLKDMDQNTSGSERDKLEIQFIKIVRAYDKEKLDVVFGKNAEGKTTEAIINIDTKKVLASLDSEDLADIIDKINDITFTDVQVLKSNFQS